MLLGIVLFTTFVGLTVAVTGTDLPEAHKGRLVYIGWGRYLAFVRIG